MIKNIKTLSILVFLFLFQDVFAKWWIFGRSESEIELKYLYFNNVSYDDSDKKIVFYKDLLTNGVIDIKGKAYVKNISIGSVMISLDGKESWQKAKFSSDGEFMFSFKPELGKLYRVYVKVIDTRGRSNNIEKTYKEIEVINRDLNSEVKEMLNNLVTFYNQKNIVSFMMLISNEFVPDKVILERAVRKDFNIFESINLRFIINNIQTDEKGKILVSINFTRTVSSKKTGKILSDNGTTEFLFRVEDKGLRVYGMRYPLIFGLSEPREIIIGVVNSTNNQQVIVVDKTDISITSFTEAVDGLKSTEVDFASTVLSGSANLTTAPEGYPYQSLKLSNGQVFSENNGMGPVLGDFAFMKSFTGVYLKGVIVFKSGTKWLPINANSIEDVKEVPNHFEYNDGHHFLIYNLKVFAVYTTEGKYALVEIVSHNYTNPLPTPIDDLSRWVSLKYKYQSNGSRRFK